MVTTVINKWFAKAHGRRETLQPSLLPSLGDERQELLQKTFERKLPWTEMETQYYDAVSFSFAFTFIIGHLHSDCTRLIIVIYYAVAQGDAVAQRV